LVLSMTGVSICGAYNGFISICLRRCASCSLFPFPRVASFLLTRGYLDFTPSGYLHLPSPLRLFSFSPHRPSLPLIFTPTLLLSRSFLPGSLFLPLFQFVVERFPSLHLLLNPLFTFAILIEERTIINCRRISELFIHVSNFSFHL